jgi:serine/threonine-protein kinase RsbW
METFKTLSVHLRPEPADISTTIAMLGDELKTYYQGKAPQKRMNLFHVRLALDEALLNAMEHGCRNDPDGRIQVFARFTPRLVEVTVEDPGHGFLYEDLKLEKGKNLESLMMRGLKRAKGWGLAIMQSVTSGLFWNNRGNRITLLFLLQE